MSNSYMTYEELVRVCVTGDLLLFIGEGAFSFVIKAATQTPWTHVAIIIREKDDIYVMQSVLQTDKYYMDYLTHKMKNSGVMKNRLADVIAEDHTKIYFRPLYRTIDIDYEVLIELEKEVANTPYEKSAMRLLFSVLGENLTEDSSSMFCSEFVSKCLKRFGIANEERIDDNIIPSQFTYNSSKEKSYKLKEGCFFGPNIYKLDYVIKKKF